jgi:HD-GYP domain-containing protein (c-di-GMP phosphodiesterase class II)
VLLYDQITPHPEITRPVCPAPRTRILWPRAGLRIAFWYIAAVTLWYVGAELVSAGLSNGPWAELLRGFGPTVGSSALVLLAVRRALDEAQRSAEQATAAHLAWQRRAIERTHMALIESYDATLSGWSQALDLRDRETEAHSARVTELAVRLAQQLGMGAESVEQLRRGALLHDIGKIGIPDAILHKPGALSEAEWQVMRRHPEYARDLLAPIAFLRPALDIPYYHHERWDGSGYPHGLRGEAIPLAARIFAVVDVWDALSSDRPYRTAWPADRVRDYLRAEAGRLFDPLIVPVFLALLDSDSRAEQSALRRVA